MMIRRIALATALLLAQPARAAELHFAPAENLEQLDVATLDRARATIDFAAFVLTDIPVIDALARAGRRGVAVRVYRDGSQHWGGATVARALEALAATPGVTIRVKPPGAFMHLKGYQVDARLTRTGSANFSASGLKRQDNELSLFTEPQPAQAFRQAFEAMWGGR